MTLRNCRRVLALSAMAMAALLAVGPARLKAEEKNPAPAAEAGEGTKIIISEEEEGEGLKFRIAAKGEREAGYWIGIFPQVIDKELAEKLKAKEGNGLFVSGVIPESPAAKAKLNGGDVILAAGDRELKAIEELADMVRGSEGKTIKLKVRRGDKVMDLEVTPVKQNTGTKALFFREKGERKEGQREKGEKKEGENAEAREKLEGMLRKIHERQLQAHKEAPPAGGVVGGVIYRPQPGMPGAPLTGAAMPSGLPDDMTVTIQKRGNKPARITVKQGDKKWQTTERELGMLPPPVIGYVSRMLGRPMMPGMGGFAMAGSSVAGQPQRFEFHLGEDGKTRVVTPQGGFNPSIKSSPEGIRIEIKEHGEHKGKPGEQGNVKWLQLRRPEAAQKNPEREAHELREQVEKLRRELEELIKEKKARLEREQKKER